MNIRKFFLLLSSFLLSSVMLLTTVSCSKSGNEQVEFTVKGESIKSANYIVEKNVDKSYIFNFMEGMITQSPAGFQPIDLSGYLNLKTVKFKQIFLKPDQDPLEKFKDTNNFDQANMEFLADASNFLYGVATEIVTINYGEKVEKSKTEFLIRLKDGTYKNWDKFDPLTAKAVSKWHDGITVKAQDFVFNFESMLDLENGSRQLQFIDQTNIENTDKCIAKQTKGHSFQKAKACSNLGIKALSDNLLYLKTKGKLTVDSFSNIFYNFALLPTRKDFIEKIGKGSIKEGIKKFGSEKYILGNGVFRPTYVMFDYETIFTKFADYWDKKRVPATCFKWKVIKDRTSEAILFKSGKLSKADIPTTLLSDYMSDENLKLFTSQGMDASLCFYFTFNFNSKNNDFKKAIENIHLRRAMNAAINRTDFIIAIGNSGSLPGDILSPAAFRTSDNNGQQFRDWLVNDDGTAKFKFNFVDQNDSKYEIPLAWKKYDQMVFYEKNDSYVDRKDYLHNLNVFTSELEKFKQTSKITKPIEIKLLYNSTSEAYRNGVEIVQQQIDKLIGKDILKISVVGKEQNSFLEDFKKGNFDMAFVDDFIDSKINTAGGPTSTLPFTFLKSFVYKSEDYLVNTTGKWNFWDNLFSKDPYIKSDTDKGAGWAVQLAEALNLKVEDNVKLTEKIFISKDDIELIKWYFAKNNVNSSWITKPMNLSLYQELIANPNLKLDKDVLKKYFIDFDDPTNKEVNLPKFDDKWIVDSCLPFQFRTVRILEALIRYYQPVLNISTSTAGFLAQRLIGYVTSPFQSYKIAYDCGMKIKDFDFNLPTCEAYRKPDMK